MNILLVLLGTYWKEIALGLGGFIGWFTLQYYKNRSAYLEGRETERQVVKKVEDKQKLVSDFTEAEKSKLAAAKSPEDYQKIWDEIHQGNEHY